jgi:enolase
LKSQRTKSKKIFRKRDIFFPVILVLGVIILIFNDMGIITWHHMRKDRQNIQEEIDRLIIEEKRLTEEFTRLKYDDEAIELLLVAIKNAGYKVGDEIPIALDVASSGLYNTEKGRYELSSENKFFTFEELIDYYVILCKQYPIISIEDGLDEDDWNGWKELNAALGSKVQIVGDDLTVTNPKRLQRAISDRQIITYNLDLTT